MSHERLYVYGLVRAEEPREFATQGIGGRGDRVYTLHYRDLAAVVSASPGMMYEPVLPNLLLHEFVLEEVMERFSVLPVRFGTVAFAEAVQEKLLEARYDELMGLLRDVEGKVELVLKASWRENAIFGEVLAEDPAIRRQRDEIAARPPEETRSARVQLGRMVETALWSRRDRDAAHLLSLLRPLAGRVHTDRLSSDMAVLNAAFLVDKSREEAFDRAVEALDREIGRHMVFEYFGPLAPYDFANIIVHLEG